jgi:hypothetical protein
MMSLDDLEKGLSLVQKLAWVVGWIVTHIKLRPYEPPIFGVEWRFYDEEPTMTNTVGRAKFELAAL